MKLNKILISCFTVLLVIFVVMLLLTTNSESQPVLFDVEISAPDYSEKIDYFESDDTIYVFVPSYLQLSDITITKSDDTEVCVDGQVLSERLLSDFECEREYSLNYKSGDEDVSKSLVVMKSQGVATMHIDTMSGVMDYIHDDKDNSESATMRLYREDGTLDFSGDLESISGRGNYTWDNFDKKPYNLTLSQQADLLNMGQAQRWVLLANALDDSNIRNKFLYDMAGKVGLKHTTDSQFVDLYLNGEYAGLYLLCEKIEVHEQRVDIATDDSFLVSMVPQVRVSAENYTYIQTNSTQALRVHYPESNSDEQLTELTATFQSVENAIMSENSIDNITGKTLTDLIDIDSWARKYLMEEISANWDACSVSQYFYYDSADASGRIYASPVWDYDNTLGNKNAFGTQNSQVLYGNFEYVRDNLYTPWFYHLYQKDEFYSKVVQLYQSEFLPAFEHAIETDLYDYADVISKAAVLDNTRWGIDADIVEEIEYLHSYTSERLRFLSQIWIEDKDYHTVTLKNGFYIHYIVFDGEQLPPLPQGDSSEQVTFLGWYYDGTHEPYDKDAPIDSDIVLSAKWQTNSSETFSDVFKVLPVLVFAVLLCALLLADFRRNKKRWKNADR